MAAKRAASDRANTTIAGALDPQTVAEIARRYYLADESKVAIAADVGLSRFQVARMLRYAREAGIIRIEIGSSLGGVDERLSTALQEHLGIRRAVVMGSTPQQPPTTIIRQLGRVLADLLSREIARDDMVGLGWSRVCDAMIDHLTELPRCTVVQLAGHLPRTGDTSGSVEAVRKAAEISGGDCYPIYAPMIVENSATANGLRRQPEIAEAFARVGELDRAIVSVGAWGSPRSRVYTTVGPDLQAAGRDLGVCGEISGRLFDYRGHPVDNLIGDRVLSVSLDQLSRVPQVVATAWGPDQAMAVQVAATSGWVDFLVVDETLAQELLAVDVT